MAEIVRCRPLLGTFVEVHGQGARAVEAAFAAVERVHKLMSAHDPDSELSQINRFAHRERVTIDPWTVAVLGRARYWAKLSEGAFDTVTAGRNGVGKGLLPRHPGMMVDDHARWDAVVLDEETVTLREPCCIDLGGIAKGFAVDRAIDAMRDVGAASGLVNAGGDMAGFGRQSWDATVVEPANRMPMMAIRICNEALATSALLAGTDGLSGDHLVGADSRWISATVAAPSAMDADALAKIVLAGSTKAALCLGVANARAVTIDHNGVVHECTAAFAEAA